MELPQSIPGKHRRIMGEQRKRLGLAAAYRYLRGNSIREIAGATGRSYGFTHRLLLESGVTLRKRGGFNRKRD